MHILITGSAEFLGKETTLALKKNYKLFIVNPTNVLFNKYLY